MCAIDITMKTCRSQASTASLCPIIVGTRQKRVRFEPGGQIRRARQDVRPQTLNKVTCSAYEKKTDLIKTVLT